jgi:ABC-2 type transport system ATP-binding protein
MIRVEQLVKAYGPTLAVDHLDFTIEKGEIVGFLGPNGAGKSTTMRILCGALGATSGRALVGGVDVLEDPVTVKRLVGYLPETPPLYVEMTVRQYLRFCARIKQAKDPDGAVERTMARVGLGSVAHRLIDHLSKGYRQRVGLAQALVHSPQVLVLDEPTSGLDPAQVVEIRDLVRELSQGDTTVVLSTHVLSEVEAICDRAIIVNRGRIVAQDTLAGFAQLGGNLRLVVARPDAALDAALRAVPGVASVAGDGPGAFLVKADRDVREAVASAAVRCGLLELAPQRALEEVFLALTRSAA